MICPRCGDTNFNKCAGWGSLTTAANDGTCKTCLLIYKEIKVLDSDFCIVYARNIIGNNQDWQWRQISEKYTPHIISIDEAFEYLSTPSKHNIFFTPVDKDPLEIINDPQFRLQYLARRLK